MVSRGRLFLHAPVWMVSAWTLPVARRRAFVLTQMVAHSHQSQHKVQAVAQYEQILGFGTVIIASGIQAQARFLQEAILRSTVSGNFLAGSALRLLLALCLLS